jgi:hypothetical protein
LWLRASIAVSLASLPFSYLWVALLLDLPQDLKRQTSFERFAYRIQVLVKFQCGFRQIGWLWILPSIGLLLAIVGMRQNRMRAGYALRGWQIIGTILLIVAAWVAPECSASILL